MDCEVDQALFKIAKEREQLEKELEALSNELKAAYAKAAMGGRELTAAEVDRGDALVNNGDVSMTGGSGDIQRRSGGLTGSADLHGSSGGTSESRDIAISGEGVGKGEDRLDSSGSVLEGERMCIQGGQEAPR